MKDNPILVGMILIVLVFAVFAAAVVTISGTGIQELAERDRIEQTR